MKINYYLLCFNHPLLLVCLLIPAGAVEIVHMKPIVVNKVEEDSIGIKLCNHNCNLSLVLWNIEMLNKMETHKITVVRT